MGWNKHITINITLRSGWCNNLYCVSKKCATLLWW